MTYFKKKYDVIETKTTYTFVLFYIPTFITGKLLLEFKVILNGTTLPADSRMNMGNGFHDLFLTQNPTVLYYNIASNDSLQQTVYTYSAFTNLQIAIDYQNKTISSYHDGVLKGTVSEDETKYSYINPKGINAERIVTFSSGGYWSNHSMTVYPHYFPSECSYIPAGYKTLSQWYYDYTGTEYNQLLYGYK